MCSQIKLLGILPVWPDYGCRWKWSDHQVNGQKRGQRPIRYGKTRRRLPLLSEPLWNMCCKLQSYFSSSETVRKVTTCSSLWSTLTCVVKHFEWSLRPEERYIIRRPITIYLCLNCTQRHQFGFEVRTADTWPNGDGMSKRSRFD